MPVSETIAMRPIGSVINPVEDHEIAKQRRTLVTDIEIDDQYADALFGIEAYSHLIVIFWMHRVDPSHELKTHPHGNPDLPLTGVLATRGRSHPNPMGLAVVELLKRQGCRLTVRRLDAYHGTPVLDIKPYDHYDVFDEIRVPDWFASRRRCRST